MKLLFIIPPDSVLPMIVAAPPTSLQSVKRYTLGLAAKGKKTYAVLTDLALTRVQREGVPPYSCIVPTMVEDLEPDMVERMRAYAESIKPYLDKVRIQPGDYGKDSADIIDAE
jgi:hypothetical protein